MSDSLARKLRHWSAGVYPDSLLLLDLREALRDLQNAGMELKANRENLRQIARDPLSRFEKAAEEAHRQVELCSYPAALDRLEEGWRQLEELRTTVLAWEAHDEVKKRWSGLVTELGLEDLLDLASLRIPRRLLDRARSELANRRFVKAHFVCRLVRENVERLSQRTPSPDSDLEKRIRRFREEMIARALPEPLFARLDQVQRLRSQRYSRLARNLADDLEIEHLGWRAERSRSGAGPASGADLLQGLARIGEEARTVETEIALWMAHA